MKLNYKKQLLLTIAFILVFNVMNTVFKHWIFTSIGYVLCGLLWVFHPVMPVMPEDTQSAKRALNAIRFAGVLLILIGVITRSYLY